ncbi:ras-related protein Rab-26 isoform 2 [Daubentonia madagascariensis]
MLVGDSGVGKTCLLVRFKDGAFLAGTFISTVGIDFRAWLTEIQEYAQHNVVLMLLGNKVDAAHEHVVKREDGEKLAKEYGLPFMETSAKTGLNVDLAFTAIAKELKQRSMKTPSEPRFQLHDYVKREGRGDSCCRT